MDNNIYKDKIKFEMKCSRNELMFLDTKILLRSRKDSEDESKIYLVTRMYSKPTYTHQYLHPMSCHCPHITKNMPSSVISRIRRNCSDNVKDDKIFKDTLTESEAYLMKSRYEEEEYKI